MKLREAPGWSAALQDAQRLYAHAYNETTFTLAGDIQVPGVAAQATLLLVLEALKLVDTVARTKARPARRLEFDRARHGTNVVSLYVGIDSSGVARAHTLSPEQLIEERRRAGRAALYRLTNRPIANDNDPKPEFRHPGGWPSLSEQLASNAPGLLTRMALKGRLARLRGSPFRIRNGRWEGSP